ncbi:hypothetical protein SEA_IBANTIK_94 [Streptomyces phage Ibantik]|uniref:Uncharacterized protein n=1 Tax=Streptomyces phage Ibantik TaxID=2182397 RepID=A0A2U8UPG4_9CAUD|nr:hypothetical protein QEH36_gp071 [Streptomyces phage Ibantik]AWN05316.1 hypothetical protein SEA_IBANTIK_94 [Streptomyces phage Ibantik]
MKYIATALVSIILSAGISVGITHTVMQEHTKQEVDRVTVETFNDGYAEGVCEPLQATPEGRAAYRDLVSDTTDDGRTRSAEDQLGYIVQGCLNWTE